MIPKPSTGHSLNKGDPITNGMVAFFAFSEAWSSKIRNSASMGSGSSATLSAASAWTIGRFGPAFNANGSATVSIPNLGVSGATPRTTVAWIYPTSSTGIQGIVLWGLSASPDRVWKVFFNVTVANNIYLNLNSDDWYTAANTISLNTWQQVVVSYAGGSTSSSTIKIYINGVPQTLTKAGGSSGPLNTEESNYVMGYDPGTAGRNFSGAIDAVRIYNRAITNDEAMRLYIDPFAGVNTGLRRIYSFSTQVFNPAWAINANSVIQPGAMLQ